MQVAAPASRHLQADDKSWAVKLPASWTISPASMRGDAGHIFSVSATYANAVRLSVTADFAANGVRSLKDFPIERAASHYLALQPQPAELMSAVVLPRADLFSAGLYQLRFSTDGGQSESLIKVALQQGRLYQLTVRMAAGVPEIVRRDVEDVVSSFKAYPLNIGCLSASNRGGPLLPGVCY